MGTTIPPIGQRRLTGHASGFQRRSPRTAQPHPAPHLAHSGKTAIGRGATTLRILLPAEIYAPDKVLCSPRTTKEAMEL